jgi:hypothetical protein
VIEVQITRGVAIVSMRPYKPRVVEAIRTIRGRRWDAKKKVWAIPVSTLQQSVERLVRTGELVTVNGKEWTGTVETKQVMAADRAAEIEAENEANPFIPLWKVLPPQLRQPTYDALWQVLAPGAGGDTGLLVLLDQAHAAFEENGSRVGRAS